MPAKTAAGAWSVPWALSVPGSALRSHGQRSLTTAGVAWVRPEDLADAPESAAMPCMSAIMQWCLPPRRQHAGTLESASPARARRGEMREALNHVSSKMDSSLRNVRFNSLGSIHTRWSRFWASSAAEAASRWVERSIVCRCLVMTGPAWLTFPAANGGRGSYSLMSWSIFA